MEESRALVLISMLNWKKDGDQRLKRENPTQENLFLNTLNLVFSCKRLQRLQIEDQVLQLTSDFATLNSLHYEFSTAILLMYLLILRQALEHGDPYIQQGMYDNIYMVRQKEA